MKKQPPSIFNDVIGPVMRGPSSSHTAASVRIGNLIRQFYSGNLRDFKAEFSRSGSLATTYKSQGSAIGLIGGLLGMDTDDSRLDDAMAMAKAAGLRFRFEVVDYAADHPNTYRIYARDDRGKEFTFIFISTGGGMIELINVNDIPLSIKGDLYETLYFFDETECGSLNQRKELIKHLFADQLDLMVSSSCKQGLVNLKTNYRPPLETVEKMAGLSKASKFVSLNPVMPVIAQPDYDLPFSNAAELLAAAEKGNTPLWELALTYEMARGGISDKAVIAMAEKILAVMKGAVKEGLAGTDYSDRILGAQALKILETKRSLIGSNLNRHVIAYIAAVMETKSAMSLIVAAPTAGSCGVLPGTILAAAQEHDLAEDKCVKAILAAGAIGVLIATRSTFAAEECGCQAECGAASAMTAGALVEMFGGSVKESLGAASLALQNMLGLICDPVANRVEVPCLGKNVLAGLNALAAADMVMSGFEPLIPLDETILAMDQVGRTLPAELRCTGKGGLSITKTAQEIARTLKE